MSTLKVNEIKHISNSGTSNIILESNENVNLRTTSTQALSVNGTLTVTNSASFNGSVTIGNATTDLMHLTSKVSGNQNYSGFTGEIKMYAGNAAGNDPPPGWLYCNGDTISQTTGNGGNHYNGSGKTDASGNALDYQLLFNLLKASSDWGNSSSASWGTNTVKLPDFRSRSPVGVHTGAANTIGNGSNSEALTQRTLGDTSGSENHVLVTNEIPAHNHPISMTSVVANITAATTLVIEATLPNHVHPMAHTHEHPHTHAITHDHPETTTSGVSAANTAYHPLDMSTVTLSYTGASGTENATHVHTMDHTHPYTNPTIGSYGGVKYDGSGTAVENPTVNGGTTGSPSSSTTSTEKVTGDTSTDASHTHTINHSHGVPAHRHSMAHTHTFDVPNYSGNSAAASEETTGGVSTANTTNPTTNPSISFTGASGSGSPVLATTITDATHNHVGTITNTGGGLKHTNLSPIISCHYIIKV